MGVEFTLAQGGPANGSGDSVAVTLTQVTSGGPAAQAGLTVGRHDHRRVGAARANQFRQPFLNLFFAHQPGDTVQFTVSPRRARTTVTVTLGERPAAQAQ